MFLSYLYSLHSASLIKLINKSGGNDCCLLQKKKRKRLENFGLEFFELQSRFPEGGYIIPS